MIIPPRRTNPRTAHRVRQSELANNSLSVAEKFPALKSIKVNLEYFDADGVRKNGELIYKANLRHAKSVFGFDCRNAECVGGDFDLSDILAEAVANRRRTAEGELLCQGWRGKAAHRKAPCRTLLRYKLSLVYV